MIIHKGKNVQPSWFTDSPAECMVEATESGYINKETFTKYIDNFVDWLIETGKLDNNQTHLVLMDGHTAHTNNWSAIQSLIAANIQVILIPAHTSHFLQPLDKNPFSSFKFWWNICMEEFNRRNAGKALNNENFFSVFNLAWNKGMTPHNIRVGFKRTGIFPLDRSMISDDMVEVHRAFCELNCERGVAKMPPFPCIWVAFGCVRVAFGYSLFACDLLMRFLLQENTIISIILMPFLVFQPLMWW